MSEVPKIETVMSRTGKPRCPAITPYGKQCTHSAYSATGYCARHADMARRGDLVADPVTGGMVRKPRADAPLTPAEAMARCEAVAALVSALAAWLDPARQDLENITEEGMTALAPFTKGSDG